MKPNFVRNTAPALVLLGCAPFLFAQTTTYNQPAPQQYQPPQNQQQQNQPQAESVRPGTLNYVEGQVTLDGEALTQHAVGHTAVQPGQTLDTSDNGYAEFLLTPGAFLRIGPNSEFRMPSVGLADTRIQLSRGDAMIETDQLLKGTHLEVTIGRTSIDLLKKGLYEFSTAPPSVRTYKGQANVVGLDKDRKFGGSGEVLLANNDNLKVKDFNQREAKKAPLYVWSEARSRNEAAQNQLVAQDSSGYVPVGSGWFWDPYADYYGFWGPDAFYSPFGFGFYGGFYPGFYGGYWGGRGGLYPGGWRVGRRGGYNGYRGFHGNGAYRGGAGGFRGGGFHGGGGGFHGGGGGFHGGGGGHR